MSHVKFEFHSNLDTLTYFTAKNRSKSFVCIHGFKKLYRGLRFGTHTQIVSVLTPIDFCHAWAIFGPLVDKTLERRVSRASSQWHMRFEFHQNQVSASEEFLDFFLNVVPYQLESWFIHWVGCTTYWVHVSLEWDPCDLHVLSLGTVN